MADLIELSARIIDSDVADVPVNRVTEELSEIGDGLAMVESFSHCALLDTGDGLVAFDASGKASGRKVTQAIAGWRETPVTHLVYTNGHLDHVGGSPAFAERWGAPVVVGHENVGARFERYQLTNDWNVDINARQFGGVRADLGMMAPATSDADLARWRNFLPSDVLWPDRSIGERESLTVGGETIELFHARGETDDHLWSWLPKQRAIMSGDFLIWNFPNAGNPQKVQRYPIEWVAALRAMVAMEPELLNPAHGLPIGGRDRIAVVLNTVADALDLLVRDVLAMMNDGAKLDEIVHTVQLPAETLALPYLRPLYDEPEFVVRGIWRQFGGWGDGAASRLKPAPDAQVGAVVAELAGGTAVLLQRAEREAEAGNLRLACHLVDFAGWAAPDDPDVHDARAAIYKRRRSTESSLMSKGIYAAAARESEAVRLR